MSAPKAPILNLYGYEDLKLRNPQPVDPVLDGKNTKNKKFVKDWSVFIVVASLIYVFFSYIAGFHSYRAYGTNELADYIPRVVIAVLLGPFYVLYVIIKTNIHSMFGLAKGADLITMFEKPYYLYR